jgi:formamidopyrimidine-DNA glycosylase
MPELPEVETIARGLATRVTDDVIESIWLGEKPEPLKSPAPEIAAALENTRILTVRRMGKHIVFDLARDHVERTPPSAKGRKSKPSREESETGPEATAQFIVHLGMSGRLQLCDPQSEILKHTHAILKLASGRELRFVDPRRFGRLSVAVSGNFEAVGIEPLETDLDHFVALFRRRKTPIKSALLNQKLLRGVGNIYADESLFRAKIRPRRRASTLTREELAKLLPSIQKVLREAIAAGGSSVSDYVDSNGEAGFFQLKHRVYGREGKPCVVCKTPIKRIVIAGRSSHFCPKCQK